MELNLRKANAIVLELNRLIQSTPLTGAYTVNIFAPDINVQFNSVKKTFEDKLELQLGLYDVFYSIRQKIADKNQVVGISQMVTTIAKLESLINLYTQLSTSATSKDINSLKGEMEDYKATRATNVYGYNDTKFINTVFSEEDKNEFALKAKTLKKELRNLKDKLLELNVKSNIELSDQEIKVLTENVLI